VVFVVLGGGTLWHLQKFSQCIKILKQARPWVNTARDRCRIPKRGWPLLPYGQAFLSSICSKAIFVKLCASGWGYTDGYDSHWPLELIWQWETRIS
jgi:hypothetical protein